MQEFLKFRVSVLVSVLLVQFCCGLLVRHKGIKVNYTRKIVHLSPHTWDTPTLYIAGYGALYGITRIG